MSSLAPKADDRTERIHRLSMAIKDNVLLSEDLLSIAVQASAKKQKINHDYNVTMSVQKSSVKSASKFFTNICESGSKENLPPQPESVLEGLKSVRKRLLEDDSGFEALQNQGHETSQASALVRNIVFNVDCQTQAMIDDESRRTRLDLSRIGAELSDDDEKQSSNDTFFAGNINYLDTPASPMIENHLDADQDNLSCVSMSSHKSRYSTSCSLAQVSEDAHRHLLRLLYEGTLEELCLLRGIGRVRAQRLLELQDEEEEDVLVERGEEHAKAEIVRRLEIVGMNRSSVQRFLKENLALLLLTPAAVNK